MARIIWLVRDQQKTKEKEVERQTHRCVASIWSSRVYRCDVLTDTPVEDMFNPLDFSLQWITLVSIASRTAPKQRMMMTRTTLLLNSTLH